MNVLKNSILILFGRFSLVWTLLCYYAVAGVLFASISLSVLYPYVNSILSFNLTEQVADVNSIIFGAEGGVLAGISDLFTRLSDAFSSFGRLYVYSALIFSGLMLITQFIFGLPELALYGVTSAQLSTNSHLSFNAQFIRHLGKTVVFMLCRTLILLPFDLLVFGGLFLTAYVSGVLSYIIPVLFILLFVLIYALRMTLFSAWAPAYCDNYGGKALGPIASAAASLKLSSKNFRSVYPAMVLFALFALAVNVFFGLFTLGVGLIITIPLTVCFRCVLNNVLYCTMSGRRYYVNGSVMD
jgi:hypothetical protein